MNTPLNPILYKRLKEEFRYVNTSHPGVAASISYSSDPYDNKLKMQLVGSGEYYRVNCPYCNDTRGRLWINHLWGVPNEITNSRNTWLAVCYNEDCLADYNRVQALYNKLYSFQNLNQRGASIPIVQGEIEETVLTEAPLPGLVIPLTRLQPNDPTYKYLQSRKLDINYLVDTFDVSYCISATEGYYPANNRIVIPIKMHGKLVGWQCRYPQDVDFKLTGIPKYYTKPGMAKRLVLYNFDNATQCPYVVVTEGPTDVWNVGKNAVAILGKKPSVQQLRLLCDYWADGAIVILLDGDAWDATEDFANKLVEGGYTGRVVTMKLPEGKDPSDYSREFVNEQIESRLQREGINPQDLTKRKENDLSTRRISYRPGRTSV